MFEVWILGVKALSPPGFAQKNMAQSSDTTRRYGSLLFIAALAVMFALQWGPGSQGCDRRLENAETAATVNGKTIGVKEFARAYSQRADQFRQQGIPADLLKQFGISRQVLDQLVNEELLAQAAEARGLHASDDDLKQFLRESPVFQKDGRWDPEAYQNYVRNYLGTTEVLFEDKLRRSLAAQRLLQLVESSVAVSDEEVKVRYLKEGDVANVTFVRFTAAQFDDQVGVPKQVDVATWAKDNEAAIAAHYEKNKFAYFIPEKVKARQIVLRVPPGADAAKKAEVKARAEGVRRALVDEKKDFAELAKSVSEDLETRESGGSLGFVERLALPSAFADLLFAVQPGETTALVETPAGWFIGTIDEKQAPSQRPLEAVKGEIATQLYTRVVALRLAKAQAELALAQLVQGKQLGELFPAAARDGDSPFAALGSNAPEAKQTGEFTSTNNAVPLLGEEPALKQAIFAAKAPGPLTQVFDSTDGFVVAFVDERREPSDAEFDTRRAELKVEAIKGKQFEARESFLKALKQSGSVVTNEAALDQVVDS